MASNGSIATTLTPTRETLSSSQLLSSSVSSLSNSSRGTSSQITKIYRQSSTLFLTRRLPESLSTILPVITPSPEAPHEPAPVAKASRTQRIKVWSLYLTILNAVVELDPDEGKQAFGSQEWRALCTKVRDGEVWEEVVRNGYGGVEGDVDSDVVINLATLLLAHARTQILSQQRLEAYLAASTTPNLDIADRLQNTNDPRRRAMSPSKSHGTDTPRDLNARVKILELYTLHVLLRNNEWDYAREFISISSVLDEERRDAFLQALQSLRDEQNEAENREREERRYQEEQLQKDIEDARKRRAENKERERRKREEETEKTPRAKRASSETDYGIEPVNPSSSGSNKARSAKGSSSKGSSGRPTTSSSPTARSSVPQQTQPPTLIARAGTIIANLQKLLESMAGSFKTNPMLLLRFLAFIVGLFVVLSRRDVKEVIRKMWAKVKATAGMGVKVSYI